MSTEKLSRTGKEVNDFRAQILILELRAGRRLQCAAGGRDRTAVRRHDGKSPSAVFAMARRERVPGNPQVEGRLYGGHYQLV